MDTSIAGSNKTHVSIHDKIVGITQRTTESALHGIVPTTMPKACDTIPMDVKMHEELQNLHEQFLTETSVRIKRIKRKEVDELSKAVNMEKFLMEMKNGK